MTDIKMPGLDEYKATLQIRQFEEDVIIISQTTFGLSGDMEKSLDAGYNDYISKPNNKHELQSLIRSHFKK